MRPFHSHIDDRPFVEQQDDGRYRVKWLVTREDTGGELLTAALWMEPDAQPLEWSATGLMEGMQETYYVVSGRLEVTWTAETSGTVELKPGSVFFFPPGGSYAKRVIGDEQVFVIYSLTPAP